MVSLPSRIHIGLGFEGKALMLCLVVLNMHRTERVGNGPDVQDGITFELFSISVDGYSFGRAGGWLPTSRDEAPGLRGPCCRRQSKPYLVSRPL